MINYQDYWLKNQAKQPEPPKPKEPPQVAIIAKKTKAP